MEEHTDYSSQNLLELRTNAKLSRRAFLDKLGQEGVKMHPTTLRRIEDGEQNLKVHEALAVAAVFGIDLEALVTRPVNEADAVMTSYLASVKGIETALLRNRDDWLSAMGDVFRLLQDPTFPPPNQSKAARDLHDYATKSEAMTAWLTSPDCPVPVSQAVSEYVAGHGRNDVEG